MNNNTGDTPNKKKRVRTKEQKKIRSLQRENKKLKARLAQAQSHLRIHNQSMGSTSMVGSHMFHIGGNVSSLSINTSQVNQPSTSSTPKTAPMKPKASAKPKANAKEGEDDCESIDSEAAVQSTPYPECQRRKLSSKEKDDSDDDSKSIDSDAAVQSTPDPEWKRRKLSSKEKDDSSEDDCDSIDSEAAVQSTPYPEWKRRKDEQTSPKTPLNRALIRGALGLPPSSSLQDEKEEDDVSTVVTVCKEEDDVSTVVTVCKKP